MCIFGSGPKPPTVKPVPPPPPPPTPGADKASNPTAAGQDTRGNRRRRGREALTIALAPSGVDYTA